MRWRFNSCRGHREDVSLLASGVLPQEQETSVRDHLAHCGPCRKYYEEVTKLSGELQQWARSALPVESDAAFRARWTRSIQTADAPTGTPLTALIWAWWESLWPSRWAWGALAMVWICLLALQWTMPARRATGHALAASSPRKTVTFVQRQHELSSLLESMTPQKTDAPRPRSERRSKSATT